MKHMRVLFTTVIVLFMMVVSGCVKTETGTTIHRDGRVTNQISIQLLAEAARWRDASFYKEMEESLGKEGFSMDRIPNGVEGVKTYASIKEAVLSGFSLFNPPERFGGVRYRSGWLYDVYDLDLYIKPDIDGQSNPYTREVLNQMEATYQLEVPNAVDTTNADIVSNDRKTLKWDLKKAYTEGKGISVQATFKVYHMMGIAIFVAVIVVLCIVALILLIHSKNKVGASQGYIKKVRVIAGIMLGLGALLSLFVVMKVVLPPHLDARDKVTPEAVLAQNKSNSVFTKQTPEEKTQIKLDEFAKRYKWKTLGKLLATSEHDDAGFTALVEQDGEKVIAVYSKELDELALIRNASPKTDVLKQFFIPSKYGAGSHKPYEPLGILLQRIGKHPKDITDTNVLLGGFEGTGFSANIVVLYGISTETKNIHKSGYYYGFIRHVSEFTLPKYEVRDKGNVLLIDIMLDHAESLVKDAEYKGLM